MIVKNGELHILWHEFISVDLNDFFQTAAFHYFLDAAQLGHVDGAVQSALFLSTGSIKGVPRDPDKAVLYVSLSYPAHLSTTLNNPSMTSVSTAATTHRLKNIDKFDRFDKMSKCKCQVHLISIQYVLLFNMLLSFVGFPHFFRLLKQVSEMNGHLGFMVKDALQTYQRGSW